MGYVWKQSTDRYERTLAWKNSDTVYVLMKDGWFTSKKTPVTIRLVLDGKEPDLEMLLGTTFIKGNASYGTSTNHKPHVVFHCALLLQYALTPEDLLTAEPPNPHSAAFSALLKEFCIKWLGYKPQ